MKNDTDFELDGLFKEPKVIAHAQGLVFVDGRIKEYFFNKAKDVLEKNQWDE
jgi:hypothetical protein